MIFSSLNLFGFTSRAIIALVILSYLYSKNKNDKSLKRGLTLLVVFAACSLLLFCIIPIFFLSFKGLDMLFGQLQFMVPFNRHF